jgi:hypothetical protein
MKPKLIATSGNIDSGFLDLLDGAKFADLADRTFFETRIAPWISENVDPRMVFENDTLCEWAKSQGVEDVCDMRDLELWAEANGYSRED